MLNDPTNIYKGSIFLNHIYYLVQPYSCSISIYNTITLEKKTFQTNKPYNSIINNGHDESFYVSSVDDSKNIYVLDQSFIEINIIKLMVPDKYLYPIKNLSYNKEHKTILITTTNSVYSITEEGYFIKEEIQIYAISNEYKKDYVQNNLTTKNGRHTCVSTITNIKEVEITASLCFSNYKYIAYSKNGSSFIALASRRGNIIKNIYIDDDITINSLMNIDGLLQLLVTKNDLYNYIYLTDIKCYRNNCHSKSQEKRKTEIDIIESIASIESSLAEIFNTETQKIKIALENSDKQSDILKINASINKTISKITVLEQILLDKLEIALKISNKKKN
ncbi:MAG: hypothetical protein PHT75_00300 [Bacilli bacterium]|nr:hypothetical protein [Bacilli bacterium]MDD3304563.1 hypothetical protein [Bacilli bacterium]MDD4053821.1 hypothetical protein [Bacilli bacterium]MDD4411312.1 hypothetical protein [Bacilli bacterium]